MKHMGSVGIDAHSSCCFYEKKQFLIHIQNRFANSKKNCTSHEYSACLRFFENKSQIKILFANGITFFGYGICLKMKRYVQCRSAACHNFFLQKGTRRHSCTMASPNHGSALGAIYLLNDTVQQLFFFWVLSDSRGKWHFSRKLCWGEIRQLFIYKWPKSDPWFKI